MNKYHFVLSNTPVAYGPANYFFVKFLPSLMRPRDTVHMQGFCLVAALVTHSDSQNFFCGPFWPQGTPRKGKNLRSGLFEVAVVRKSESLHI